MKTHEVVTVAVLGGAVFVGIGYMSFKAETTGQGPTWARAQRERAAAARLQRLRSTFAEKIREWPRPASASRGEPERPLGRLALVDAAGATLDDAHLQLPDALRAGSPAELTAVAWLQCESQATVEYTSGDRGFTEVCLVTVVDPGARIIASEQFVGPPPPDSKDIGSGDVHAARPSDAVVTWLSSLGEPPPAAPPAPHDPGEDSPS